MSSNIFNITSDHDNINLALRGDMALAFNQVVSTSFRINLFTTTNDLFTLQSDVFQFRDLDGTLSNQFVFGGSTGLFVELMFDPLYGVWYIVANNILSANNPALTTIVNGVVTDVSALKSTTSTTTTNVTALTTSVGTLNTSVSSLNTSVGSLNTQLTATNNAVTNVATSVSDLSTIRANQSTSMTDIATLKTTVAKVPSISTDGTSLLRPNGTPFLIVSSSVPSNSDGAADGTIYIQTTANSPVATTAPAVTGLPTVGAPLEIKAATFTNATSVLRSIYVAGTLVSGPAASATYTPVAADLGKVFTVTESATNSTNNTTNSTSANSTACAPALRSIADRVYLNQLKRTVSSMGGYGTHTFNSATNVVEVEFWNGFVNGYSNASSPTYADAGSGGTADFTCQMQVGSTFYPFLSTVDGTLTAHAADGARVTMRAYLPVTLPAGQTVKIHSWMKATGAGGCVTSGTTTGMPGNGSVTTTSNPNLDTCWQGTVADTTATGVWGATGSNITGDRLGPVAIRGISTKPAVLIMGTSIDHGEGGYQQTVYNSGPICAQLSSLGVGFTNGGIRADALFKFTDYTNAKPTRLALANHPGNTSVYIGGCVNDLTVPKSANTIWTVLQNIAAMFPGKNIVVATATPIVGINSDGTQSPTPFINSWIDINNRIRTNTFGWKVVDLAALFCPDGQPNACTWRDTSLTIDGLHPSNAGYDYARASSVVDLSKFL